MRIFRHVAVITALAGLVVGSGAAAASARTHAARSMPRPGIVRLVGGATVVTSRPGLADALLKNAIVPLATAPASQSALFTRVGAVERFVFPVTGGFVSLRGLGGQVAHAGGVLWVNVRNGKRIQVSNFVVDLGRRVLTGLVNGKARVPLFRLDLSRLRVSVGRQFIVAKGIGLFVTAFAARGLNAALGTRIFVPGAFFGTANSVLRFQAGFRASGPGPGPGPGPMGSRR